jgi:hypothetical protein
MMRAWRREMEIESNHDPACVLRPIRFSPSVSSCCRPSRSSLNSSRGSSGAGAGRSVEENA